MIYLTRGKHVNEDPVYGTTGGACPCGGAFHLTGAKLNARWEGSAPSTSGGVNFKQDESYH